MSSLLLGLLQIQLQMKLYHWQTHSHARHQSTDMFVEKFSQLIDQFVESYQGKHGRILLDGTQHIELHNMNEDCALPLDFLRTAEELLSRMLPTFIDVEMDTDLVNIRDEMLALVHQLQYLFTLA